MVIWSYIYIYIYGAHTHIYIFRQLIQFFKCTLFLAFGINGIIAFGILDWPWWSMVFSRTPSLRARLEVVSFESHEPRGAPVAAQLLCRASVKRTMSQRDRHWWKKTKERLILCKLSGIYIYIFIYLCIHIITYIYIIFVCYKHLSVIMMSYTVSFSSDSHICFLWWWESSEGCLEILIYRWLQNDESPPCAACLGQGVQCSSPRSNGSISWSSCSPLRWPCSNVPCIHIYIYILNSVYIYTINVYINIIYIYAHIMTKST